MAAVDPGLRRKDGKTIAVSFSLVEPGAPDRGDRAGVEVFGEVETPPISAQSPSDRRISSELLVMGTDLAVRPTPSVAPASL